MCIGKILLFAIVASFTVFSHVQTRAIDEEFTLQQYLGEWYDMGMISNCEEDLVQQCIMYDVTQFKYNGQRHFCQMRIPIVNIPICEYGFPIFSEDYVCETLSDPRLNVSRGESIPRWLSTVKSYNNGTELIFTDSASELCNSESHRLWSRNREVSAKTKAEFEKLAGDGTANYYSWDDCPKLRTEADENTLKQLEGKWYGVAKVYYGDIDNDTCTVINVVVDYKNQTFDMTEKFIRNGRLSKIVHRGILADSALHVEIPSEINGTVQTHLLSAVSCNNGAELIIRFGNTPQYALISRNPKVSAETMAEFRRLSDNYVDAHFTIHSEDNCANRIN